MLFSSMIFIWVFLPVVFIGNFILMKLGGVKAANILLLVASLVFYAWGEPVYILLMLFSIFMNWSFGLLIGGIAARVDGNQLTSISQRHDAGKKVALAICVILNIGLLGYFKYFDMLIATVNGIFRTEFPARNIALPIGISFFTFQALSYVIDVYRGECDAQHNLFGLALYVSFFPQLIAGPIVKYKDVSAQILDRRLTLEDTACGIRRFIYGFAKKILIANTLAEVADKIYTLPISQVTCAAAWIGSLCYTFQIYYDFSGYSDMAIGLGKMFGFTFKENFDYPYTALSVREFWRRWHISLSSWFREYVYIPLGGSRKGSAKTYRNLIVVFFLTGLWHGANWTFVFWGLYHGCFLILERIGLERALKKNKVIAYLYTFLVFHVGWIFFRAETVAGALRMVGRMFTPWITVSSTYALTTLMDHRAFASLICAVLGMGFFQRAARKSGLTEKWRFHLSELFFCTCLAGLCFMSLAANTYNPFIYFRF